MTHLQPIVLEKKKKKEGSYKFQILREFCVLVLRGEVQRDSPFKVIGFTYNITKDFLFWRVHRLPKLLAYLTN